MTYIDLPSAEEKFMEFIWKYAFRNDHALQLVRIWDYGARKPQGLRVDVWRKMRLVDSIVLNWEDTKLATILREAGLEIGQL